MQVVTSHNNMSVFFSGTDNSEINENSEFHNYYLSLIVNNKNEMCAKIAFRTKVKENVQKKISYRDTNGVFQEATFVEEKENDYVYVYDCEIVKENSIRVEESFISRVDEVIKQDEERVAAKKTKQSALYVPQQASLFGKSSYTKTKPSDFAVNAFMCKLLSLQDEVTYKLPDVLKSMQKEIGTSLKKANNFLLDQYLSAIEDILESKYLDEFGDQDFEYYELVIDEMIHKLSIWEKTYWIAKEIKESLGWIKKHLVVSENIFNDQAKG